MLITYWIWSACPPRLRSKGNQIGYPDKPEVCRTRSTVTFYNRALHDAINVFDPVTLLELRRAAHLCQILRPASRDQIRDRAVRQRSSVIRQRCQRHQQRTTRVTGFPPTSDPSVISSRLDLQKHHQIRLGHRRSNRQYLEASRSIFSSRYVQNRQTLSREMQNFFLQRI